MKPFFQRNSISIGLLPYSFVVGISYDKPDLFIALGVFYIEIGLSNKRRRKKKPTPKPKHPNSGRYNYF